MLDNELSYKEAVLYSSSRPSEEQEKRLIKFLNSKYGDGVNLQWEQSDLFPGGFRIQVGSEIYDWSVNGRFQQLKDSLVKLPAFSGNVIPLLKSQIEGWVPRLAAQELGTVIEVGDGIAKIEGLDNAAYGEIVAFSSGEKGMVLDLKPDSVGCILFDNDSEVCQGDTVCRTKKTAGMPVGEAFLGRVVDSLGMPIDGRGEIPAEDYIPIERSAPSIIQRQSVNTPLATGILSIDSMFPIGRGQRELIIGDRQTGKTAIALDTILNQKDQNVICIYVAIGQKASSVAKLVDTLRKRGAMDYSIVVSATASDTAPIQYIAPYAGCALGEYFMNKGKDVLIVYDDLSKHAIAYRTISLLLERSPGREAYPGDVFYLHSRLLERSARLSDAIGGGSMTALPIVETQASDVSAYIPTNIISITDGQIFLESDLFNIGQRPAVNIGLSVSRVGGDAQTKAMKAAASTIRLELAQYREMEVFTQFASDLDDATRQMLRYGEGLMCLLRQDQYQPMKLHEQVISLVAALNHIMQDIPVNEIKSFQQGMLSYVKENCAKLCSRIDAEGVLESEMREEILKYARNYQDRYTRR